MQDVLDDLEKAPRQRDDYARLAFALSLITMCLLGYLFFFTPVQYQMADFIPRPSKLAVILTQVFCLLGLVLTVASIHRREPLSWYQVVGTILNCLWLVLVIALLIYAQMMDYL